MGEILFELVAALCQILAEVLFEFILQAVLELVAEVLASLLRSLSEFESQIVRALGLTVGGAACGWISLWPFPKRLFVYHLFGVSGLSLIVVPLLTGMAMKWFGDRLRRKGRQTSSMATLWGGATFAFFAALVRWLLVGRVQY